MPRRAARVAAGGAPARDAAVRVRARGRHPPGVGRRGRAPARHHSRSRTSASAAPFVDKHAIRRFRDERGDPYGGLCALPPDELTAVMSTSGTTGDPTLVPEKWGGGSGRPVDHHARLLGDGRAARRSRRARAVHLPRPDVRVVPGPRHDPRLVRLRPGRDGALLRSVAPVPADRALQLRLGAHQRGARGVRTARPRPARTCSRRTRASCSRASR